MCGIAGIHIKDPNVIKKHNGLERFVDELFLGIEPRGKHASGFVATTFGEKKRVVMDKSPVTASDFIKDRERIPENAQTILLHTRYETQGSSEFHGNNHPVVSGTCFAVHNGHISNDDEIFEEYQLQRNAQVDSEAIAALAAHFGITDPAVFLSKLGGNMATAVIDPVRVPGRLVLAKGVSSPLVYIDTPKFLVWASTKATIERAWGAVLGTPPQDKAFLNLAYGKGIVYDNDVREDFEFKPFYKTYTGNYGYGGNSKDYDDAPARVWKNGKWEDATYKVDPKGEVSKWAPEDDDADVIRTREIMKRVKIGRFLKEEWCKVPTIDDATPEQREAILRENNGTISWSKCPSCQDMVPTGMIMQSLKWGRICTDCIDGNIAFYQEKASKDESAYEAVEGEVCAIADGQPYLGMPKAFVDKLDRFAVLEYNVHRDALKALEESTGIDRDSIDWMIFRAPSTWIDEHLFIADIRAELDSQYQELVDDLWETMAQDGHIDLDEIDSNRGYEKADDDTQPGPNLNYCKDHAAYYTESCEMCSEFVTKIESDIPELPDVEFGEPLKPSTPPYTPPAKCACGRFMNQGKGKCWVCKNADKAATSKSTALCAVCGVASEIYTKNGKANFGWCLRHFAACTTGDCMKDPNMVTPSGEWKCHVHARGIKGCKTEKQLREGGMEFVEERK